MSVLLIPKKLLRLDLSSKDTWGVLQRSTLHCQSPLRQWKDDEKYTWIRDAEQMATSCGLAGSRHEHEFALLESLSASWRSRSGLGWSSSGSCGWSGLGRRTRARFCQSRPDHRSQYQHAVWHTILLRSVRSNSTMFYTRMHLRRFGFKLRLRKGAQNTHMVAER